MVNIAFLWFLRFSIRRRRNVTHGPYEQKIGTHFYRSPCTFLPTLLINMHFLLFNYYVITREAKISSLLGNDKIVKNTRKCTLIVLGNLGLRIEWWCQKFEWKLRSSNFCICAEKIWQKSSAMLPYHHNFNTFAEHGVWYNTLKYGNKTANINIKTAVYTQR